MSQPSSSSDEESSEQVISMITGKPKPKKQRLVSIVEPPPAHTAIKDTAWDPDFDEDDGFDLGGGGGGGGAGNTKKRKKPAALPKAVPPKPSTPASQKATPRIQACGEKQLDRCVMAARDNGPDVHVIVVSLSFRLKNEAGADEVWRMSGRDGTGYDLCPPYEPKQSDLGEAEFLGLFFSGVCDPGVGAQIAEVIVEDPRAHVVVVDPSNKGDNFARLAACVGALKVKYRDPFLGASLYREVLKPKDPTWKKVLAAAKSCRTNTVLQGKMRDYYHDHL